MAHAGTYGDDLAASTPLHARNRRPGAIVRAKQIGANRLLPGIRIAALHGTLVKVHTRIEDCDVNSREFRFREFKKRLYRILLPYVRPDPDRGPAPRPDLPRDFLDLGPGPRRAADRRTLPCVTQRDSPADAPTGARYDRCLAYKRFARMFSHCLESALAFSAAAADGRESADGGDPGGLHPKRVHPLERLHGEIKRRTNVVGIFTNDDAITRLIGVTLVEQNGEWAAQKAR